MKLRIELAINQATAISMTSTALVVRHEDFGPVAEVDIGAHGTVSARALIRELETQTVDLVLSAGDVLRIVQVEETEGVNETDGKEVPMI